MWHGRKFGVIGGVIGAATLLAAIAASASMLTPSGPPLICTEVKIGEARTLPLEAPSGFDKGRLAQQTLELLTAETPILVRMETLRRALLLGSREPQGGALNQLLVALQGRVLDQEARGKSDALAWFDAGYMAATWDQLERQDAPEVGLAEGCIGYAWVRKALAVGKDPGEMEFAAALITHPAMHKGTYDVYRRHLVRAIAGAQSGSLLEQNLKDHCTVWNESYEQLKQKGGPNRDGGRKLALPGLTMTVETAHGEGSRRTVRQQEAAPEDARMAAAARRGDRAAWNWLYRRYARLVHGVLISRVPPSDAEDLVQDVFAKAMRTITSVRDDACMGAWLAAVARNRATDFMRQRRRRRTSTLEDAAEPTARPERSVDAAEVLAAIRRLPDAYRETLALRLVEGLTGPEIAQRMGMTHGSVRVNLHRGMAMLREALGMETTP